MRHAELTLDEMLADEIVQLVMRRDGVSETEVRDVVASLRRHWDGPSSVDRARAA